MRPHPGIGRRSRAGALMVLAMCLLWLCAGAATAATATAPWSPVQSPAGSAWDKYDASAFGATGLALAGDGHVAVTRDGGRSWRVVVPNGLRATAFTAIAFAPSGRGVVASGGLLLVTGDFGKTWRAPTFAGPGPGAAINDVSLRGSRAVAVGDAGTILSSSDAGATWRRSTSPTVRALTAVAIAGDGTAVVGSAAGEILVGKAGAWVVAGAAAGSVTSVTASDDPAWGDGLPDLFAAAGGGVLGSDDALTFASLPGLPDLSSQAWPAVAWVGVPQRSLLIAGAQQAGFFSPTSQVWLSGPTGLGGVSRAVAPGGQSVAYLLGTDGRLVRTLSAGQDPAVVTLAPGNIVVGGRVRLTATVRVGAPGALILRSRIPGRRWATERRVSWTSADWSRRLSFVISPSFTHDYLLEFEYGGTVVRLASAAQVVVKPKVVTARSRFDLHAGDVFRFSGTVAPKLTGERVELFTDRGGSWRPVSLQRSVAVRNGRTWTSRRFGTPKAETYHLRAHLPRTRAHGEAWSRIVTVAIR